MIRQIVRWPSRLLQVASQPVGRFDERLIQLASDMHATMTLLGGIGISAVQVGVPINMIVIGTGVLKDELWALVNPRIIKEAGTQTSREGCLSFPRSEWNRPIKRALRIVVE